MPSGGAAFSPLKLISPIQLGICLLLFFLPWVEVQCSPEKAMGGMGGMGGANVKTSSTTPSWSPLMTQSGLQVATGGYSISDPTLRKMMDEGKKQGGGGMGLNPGGGNKKADGKKEKDGPDGAPLLFVFPLLLVAGAVVGIVLPGGMARRVAVAGCAAGALAVVGLQAVIGFPMETEIKKEIDKEIEQEKQFAKQMGNEPKKSEPPFRVKWQFGLYLTFLLLLTAIGTAFVDGGNAPQKYKKRRRDDDDDYDDEDDDDDDDDRPRRKRKQEVEEIPDDDDDDKPRKRRRDDDDDEDEKPRKRRRDDDDDDDDDRPRRRR